MATVEAVQLFCLCSQPNGALNMEKVGELEEEFNNFMVRVTEVENIVKSLSSSDKEAAKRAVVLADNILKGNDNGEQKNGRPSTTHCRYNRTVVNQKAFDCMGADGGDPEEMSKEMFMAKFEKDAAARTKDRLERKEKADSLKAKANQAFKRCDYDGALVYYNEAIDTFRESCVLYENRALTCLHLQLYLRAIDDCNWALRINENSLKALLYKARAFYCLADLDGSEACIKEALEKHEKDKDLILRYKESWAEKTNQATSNS